MKLIINTASTYKGGSVQVAYSFIEECKKFKACEFHVILGEMLSELVDRDSYPDNFTFHNIGYRPATKVFSLKSHNYFFKKLENEIKPDVVFTTSGPAYWRPDAPHLVGYNLPHYIYRDSPFFSLIPVHKRVKWDAKGAIIKYFFKKDADAYVVQTDDVNQRLRRWLNTNRVYTVSNTYNQHYINPKKVADKLPVKEKGEFRLLTFSAWYPHKNLSIIPEVINTLSNNINEKVRFVLTLPDEIFQRNFSDKNREQIRNVGPVRPEEGPALYKECDALFLPTLLECFSASYAEAMAMEKPIATSDLGFAHSVCGDAALYFDPVDPGKIAHTISQLVSDTALQQRLINDGEKQVNTFVSSEKRAEKFLRICKNMANAGKN